jgi:hypothetical protein
VARMVSDGSARIRRPGASSSDVIYI